MYRTSVYERFMLFKVDFGRYAKDVDASPNTGVKKTQHAAAEKLRYEEATGADPLKNASVF